MNDITRPLPHLSPVSGLPIEVRFDGGSLSSDAGILILRQIEEHLDIGNRIANCIDDPRNPKYVTHTLAEIIRFRMMMIAAGYEDGNDADRMRNDPIFKMALDRKPISDAELCPQPTISRLENTPDVRELIKMGRSFIDLYCSSFDRVPKSFVLDFDDTFDTVHGAQQLCFFNAHYGDYGFLPIVVFDGEGRFVTAILRPAKTPKGSEIRAHLRRVVRAVRSHWPSVDILVRGDSHYCGPEVVAWCRANRVDFCLGLATSSRLRKHVLRLEERAAKRYAAKRNGKKVRFCMDFYDCPASWERTERIIARVEAGPDGVDTRFIVTNLEAGKPKHVYENVYCRRGCAENHIKSFKRHLAADRTSCCKATDNQFRLVLHAGAYWILWMCRRAMPKNSPFRTAQYDTLRLRFIKIAARVVELKTKIKVHLPTVFPHQEVILKLLPQIHKLAKQAKGREAPESNLTLQPRTTPR